MRHLHSLWTLISIMLIAAVLAGCTRGTVRRRAERELILRERITQAEAAIKSASAQWSKASQAKDLDKTMSFYADDALVLSPKAPIARGKENIRNGFAQMFAIPGPGLSFSTSGVEVARSGDLGWEYGTYEFGTTDKRGKTTKERGKYLAIWRKQPDGSWKAVADINNTDQ